MLLVVERLLMIVGLAALGYAAGSVGGTILYQNYESQQLDEVLRGAHAAPAGATPAAVRRVLGRLEIPTLGVSTIVREGEDARTLQLAIGHIAGACFVLARRAIIDVPTLLVAGAALGVAWRFKIPEPLLIVAGATAGLVIIALR